MEINQKSLPSEKLQKEFEDNPLKILENIRNEKDSQQNETNILKKKINSKDTPLSDTLNSSINNEEGEKSSSNEYLINEKSAQNDLSKIMNGEDVNFSVNSNKINNNNSNNAINCNDLLVNKIYNDKNKITVNNLSIFFNINNSYYNKDYYVNKNSINNINYGCKNNNICNKKNNNSEEANSTSSQSNEDDKNNFNNNNNSNNYNISESNNDCKIMFFSNINVLLNNLKTFKGSIISQEFIENIQNENECSILFNNIKPYICTIMCLEYGNYFFQKLLKILNLKQKLEIYQIIEPNFYDIAANKFGTHSIQSLIDNIQTTLEIFAINQLISKNMYFLFTDNNAYHIIMKLILDFPEEQRNTLNMFLVMNVEKIIINCNGAFCINKFILHNQDLNLRALLIKNMEKNIKELIFNKYYCINLLLILETFGIYWGSFIIKEIQNNFGVLCQHPVSNIFINKILLFLNNNYSFELKVLLWSLYKNIVLMRNLIANKNNNIINQLIDLSDDEQKKYLFLFLNSNGNL